MNTYMQGLITDSLKPSHFCKWNTPSSSSTVVIQPWYFRSSYGGSMSIPANQTPKQLAASVLEYLALYAQAATMRNDHRTADHYRDCWLLVFQTFYGGCSLPRLRMQVRLTARAAAAPAAKPQWHALKYGRPARKVIAQVSERIELGKRHGSYADVQDVLECGHKMAAAIKQDGSRASLWRYCNACKPKGQQTIAAASAARTAA